MGGRVLHVGGGSLAILLLAAASFSLMTHCDSPTCQEKADCAEPTPPRDAGAAGGGGGLGGMGMGGMGMGDGSPASCQPTEDCTNGVDDDCNGAIDCADPACDAGFACVAAPPAGWSGPGILYEGSDAGAALSVPGCPAGFSVDAFDGTADPSAPPAVCGCACGSPLDVLCSPTVSFFYDSSCGDLCASASLAGGACAPICSGAQTMSIAMTADGGACTPLPTTQVAPATWGTVARVCRPALPNGASGGCGPGQVCAAKGTAPFAPFEGGFCIWQSGAVACPDPSQTSHTYFTGGDDTRGCAACTCGPPAGVTCGGGTATTYSDTACTSNAAAQTDDGACISAPAGAQAIEATTAGLPASGSCNASVVLATGGFSGSGATTVCCAP